MLEAQQASREGTCSLPLPHERQPGQPESVALLPPVLVHQDTPRSLHWQLAVNSGSRMHLQHCRRQHQGSQRHPVRRQL